MGISNCTWEIDKTDNSSSNNSINNKSINNSSSNINNNSIIFYIDIVIDTYQIQLTEFKPVYSLLDVRWCL